MAENGRQNGKPVVPEGETALLVAFAGGRNVRDSAEVSGISERTVYRRLANPDFRRQVTELRWKMLDEAAGRLADATTAAALTMTGLLQSSNHTVRLRAAQSILNFALRFRESRDLDARQAMTFQAQHSFSVEELRKVILEAIEKERERRGISAEELESIGATDANGSAGV